MQSYLLILSLFTHIQYEYICESYVYICKDICKTTLLCHLNDLWEQFYDFIVLVKCFYGNN